MTRMDHFSQWYTDYLLLLTGMLFSNANGQAYNSQYQSSANYPMSYQTQSYQQPMACNDLLCKTSECCIETNRGAICIALSFLPEETDQLSCKRLKRCTSNNMCPTDAPCCSTILDITYARTNSHPASNNGYSSNSYGSNSYGYGSTNYASITSYSDETNFKEGYCAPKSKNGAPCGAPIDGVTTDGCPCELATDVCNFYLQPFSFGTCDLPE